MSRDGRKPWEIPVVYNDDRWVEPKSAENMAAHAVGHGATDNGEERSARDIEEILNRPDGPREEREYECKDTTPVNYDKGPHDDELDVSDKDFDEAAENVPVNYERGPHDDEFGVEDDEELEPADDGDEFPDI